MFVVRHQKMATGLIIISFVSEKVNLLLTVQQHACTFVNLLLVRGANLVFYLPPYGRVTQYTNYYQKEYIKNQIIFPALRAS